MSNKSEILKDYIISLSEADNFEEAKEEWKWTGVSFNDAWDKCPCSQAIKEVCHIQNKINGNTTHVGNNCINKFLEIKTGSIFNMIKKLMEDNNSIIPINLISYSEEFGYIYGSEVDFLKNLIKRRGRPLSEKQTNWRNKIVRRILERIEVAK